VDNTDQFRVLIVEDDNDSANILACLLQAHDYAAEAVVEGTQAISRLLAFVPHIVLLDIAMPRINGYELAKKIRQQPGFESIPIIAISGYGDNAHKQRSIEAGINYHLLKPVAFDTLKELLGCELTRPG
jgi:two-component system CheB/CheR fusion protein